MYTICIDNTEDIKKIKGIKKGVIKKEIEFDDYLNCLLNKNLKIVEQRFIRSKNHNIFSIKEKKIALNPYDDKRFLLSEEFANSLKLSKHNTLPWGHYKINERIE